MELLSPSAILARLAEHRVAAFATLKGRSAQVRYRTAPRPVTAETTVFGQGAEDREGP